MSNAISKTRLKLLFNFYRPAMRTHLLVCGSVLVLCYFAALSALGEIINYDNNTYIFYYSIAVWLAGALYFTGPLVFAWCRNRTTVITLPASWQEKALLMLGYVLVLYPAFMATLWFLCVGIASFFCDYSNVVSAMINYTFSDISAVGLTSFMRKAPYVNVCSDMLLALLTCFVIVLSRKHRMARAIGSIFAGMFLMWLIGAILGIMAAFNSTMDLAATSGDNQSANAFVENLFSEMWKYMPAMGLTAFGLSVCLIIAIVLIIKNRQA